MISSNMWNYKYLNLKQIIWVLMATVPWKIKVRKQYTSVRAFENFSGYNNKDFRL